MTHTYRISMYAVAGFLLLCSACAAILGAIAGELSLRIVAKQAGTEIPTPPPVTIVLDAGHGGEDGGTQSAAGMLEKIVNLDIAQMLNTMLSGNGIATRMTRQEDILLYDRNVDYHGRKKVLDLAARRKMAEETPEAVFVSIHMNAFPETKYHGLQVFYSPNHAQSQMLAEEIQTTTRAILQSDNEREVKKATSTIYLLDRLKCPAVLVECGFLSNPEEAAKFETAEYRKKIAFVLFCSLMDYISTQGT